MLYDDPKLRLAFGDHLRPGGAELTCQALDLFPFPKGGRIADLGCGTGATLKTLTALGFEATGLDISPALLAEAAGRGVVTEGDFHCLPWPDGYFDGLFCECSLSLARNPRLVLEECARVLKNKGGLIISDLIRKESDKPQRPAETLICASGAMTMDELSTLLITTAFKVRHQINHDKTLKELAARLVWRLGSAEEMKRVLGIDCGVARGQSKFGYRLIVAEKESQ